MSIESPTNIREASEQAYPSDVIITKLRNAYILGALRLLEEARSYSYGDSNMTAKALVDILDKYTD